MELLGLIDIPNWILFTGCLLWSLYWYTSGPQRRFSNIGLPGPPMRWVVGNGLDAFSSKEHFGLYQWKLKQKYGPLIREVVFRQPCIIIFNLDMLKDIMVKHHADFVNRRNVTLRGIMRHGLFDQRGERWRHQRRLVTPFFSPGKLKRNFKSVVECADNLTEYLSEKSRSENTINIKHFTTCFSVDVISKTGFGLDVNSCKNPNDPFVRRAREISDIVPRDLVLFISAIFPVIGTFFEKFGITSFPSGLLEFFAQSTKAAIDLRKQRKERTPDFVDAMIKAHEEELDAEARLDLKGMSEQEIEEMKRKGMSDDEIVANGITLFLAGSDTTASVLAFLFYSLAHLPEWQQKCFDEVEEVVGKDEINYEHLSKLRTLEMCINETLRFFPPIYFFNREASQDIVIQGQMIPKGTSCICPVWAIHHDEEFWPDPETFDPARFTAENSEGRHQYSFVPFGIGPRHCVGMRLAWIEIKVLAVKMLKRFVLHPEDRSQYPPELKPAFLIQPKEIMKIKLVSRD